VFQSRTENSEVLHGLRDLNLERIGPFNETNKLSFGTSRLNNETRQTADLNGKRGSKRKANDPTYGSSSYYDKNDKSSSSNLT
jgi:hypothetical protein